jgi:predicted RNase H-like HicB family nuclease
MKPKKSLEHYLSLNYPYELIRDTVEGGYFAAHPDLDGCAAQGESAEEAVAQLDVARELWIETRLEDGLGVPEPAPEEPSGRVSLRMPSSLHAKLIRIAERQGVSLNLLLNSILAEYVGGASSQITLTDIVRELSGIVAAAPDEKVEGDGRYSVVVEPSYVHESS